MPMVEIIENFMRFYKYDLTKLNKIIWDLF